MSLPFILAGPTLPFEEVNATSLTAYSQLHGKAAMTLPIQPATNAAGVANPVYLYSVDGQESVVKPLPSVRSDSTRVVQWCRALEQLPRHDNVVVPSHVVFSRGSAFLVMPYTRSYNLTEYRRQVYGGGPLPEEAVRLLALDILCGLYHLRVHSLVHRNLHPGNVLVDASTGVGRLTDLSYAQVLHNGAAALSLERRHESAWAWTDPALAHLTTSHHTHHELDNNSAAATRTATTAATPAVDIWGFGMLLHAMCGATGKPFVYPSNGDLRAIVAKEYMTSIYSDDLMDLLRLCLNPDPTRRPTVFQIMKHNFIFPAVLLALEASRIPGKPSATGFSGAFSGLATQIRQSSLLENMATAVGGVKERASGLFSALFASVNNSPATTPLPTTTTTATTSATGTTSALATDTNTSGTTPLQQSASSAEHTPPPSLTSMPDREKVMSITTEGVHAQDMTGTQAASTGAPLLQPHKDTTQMTQTGPSETTTTAATTSTPHINASQQQTSAAAGHATLTSTPSLAPRLIHHELVCGTKLSNRNQIETSSHGQPQLLADYGLLFDIEVRNGTLVLEDLFFSAAAARNTMLVQLWWRPVTGNNNNRTGGGATTTSAMQSDITSATFVPSEMRLAGPPQAANEATIAAGGVGSGGGENGWHAVLPQPKQLSNITPRATLAVGPFQLPLHTNASANSNNNRVQSDVEDRPRRYSLLLCTNSPHGVRYYGAAHGLVEREVGEVLEEDAAMAVYMGVACGHAVWRALAGDKGDMTTNNHNQAHNNSNNTTTTTTTATAQAAAAAAAGHVVLGGNTNNNNKHACSPAEGPHTMQSTREGHSEEVQGTHTVTHVHVDAEPPTLTEALSETVVQETHAKGLCGSLKYSILD